MVFMCWPHTKQTTRSFEELGSFDVIQPSRGQWQVWKSILDVLLALLRTLESFWAAAGCFFFLFAPEGDVDV